VNYFEHHIGDYAEATAHLTFVEDAAYSRMIRKYYAQEKPLPVDVKAVQRLVGARAKEEREAVATVLEEFFVLAEDGWHNSRCDAEIARFRDGEPEREAKKANEDNRMKRHREERARLFKVLTDAGQHAPWNIGMNELRELVKRVAATATATPVPPLPATAPATPATATQTPVPNTHTPELKPYDDDNSTDSSPASSLPPEFDDPGFSHPGAAPLPPREDAPVSADPAIILTVALRKLGVDATFTHPTVRDWTDRKITMEVLTAAVGLAREQKGPTAKIPPNYLMPIVEKLLNPPPATASGRPIQPPQPIAIRKPQGTDPKGPDESYEDWQARVDAAERAIRQRQNP
jgi:uncharacterized protein YdaU (DUF1376 family)